MKNLFSALLITILLAACSDDDGGGLPGPEAPVPAPVTPLSEAVMLSTGPIEGGISERAAVWQYRGIPFAAAPVGDLRWRAPQPVESWTETRPATEFSDYCPQTLYFTNVFDGSEDCLYLNVYRPQTQDRDLPVFMWIHGGGNNNGDTGQVLTIYDGARLAEQGNMVVVTVQYRLGELGWLYHPALQTGDPLDDSGNYATLDLIAALEWIQQNAEAFGGNPDNVTIAGQSAGGGNVLSLMTSDLASGLFHRAIVQSLGATINSTDEGLADSSALVDELTALSGAPDMALSNEELAAYLRSLDAETILNGTSSSELFGDGFVLPSAGFDVLDSGNFPNKVPILLGTNRDESKLYTNPLGFNEYPDETDEVREAIGRYSSDAWRARGADQLATRLRGVDDMADIYVYRFNWGSPDEDGNSPLPGDFGATGGAFHTAEVNFMMGNDDIFAFPDFTNIFFNEGNAASRATMADIMVTYWSSFAAAGDPNNNQLPSWEPWSNAEGGFKAVTLDVNYADNTARVEPDFTVFTEQGVIDAATENLPPEILEIVLPELGRGG